MVGAGECAVEALENGKIFLHGDRLDLVLILVVEEEEQLILLDGPAQREAGIAAGEERIGEQGLALKSGIGGHVVVAIEEVGAAVEIVGTAASHYIDGAG